MSQAVSPPSPSAMTRPRPFKGKRPNTPSTDMPTVSSAAAARGEKGREARAHSAMSLSTLNPHIVHEQGCGWQGKGESLGSVAMQHKSAVLGKDSYE